MRDFDIRTIYLAAIHALHRRVCIFSVAEGDIRVSFGEPYTSVRGHFYECNFTIAAENFAEVRGEDRSGEFGHVERRFFFHY